MKLACRGRGGGKGESSLNLDFPFSFKILADDIIDCNTQIKFSSQGSGHRKLMCLNPIKQEVVIACLA